MCYYRIDYGSGYYGYGEIEYIIANNQKEVEKYAKNRYYEYMNNNAYWDEEYTNEQFIDFLDIGEYCITEITEEEYIKYTNELNI